MSLIKEEDIAQVRERVNIVEVISDYVSLKKAGRIFKGLCPFHNEKTPSFVVDPDKQLYHCFGCDEGGNIFNFLMKIDHMDFSTAVETLAKRSGFNLSYVSSPDANKRRSRKDSIHSINEEAVNFYHAYLMKSPKAQAARNYLKSRGYGQSTAKKFKLGYSPSDNALTQHFLKKGLKIKQLTDAGLAVEGRNGHIDRFRYRLMFPIADIKGNWIGMGGRVLNPEQQPKYVNSPETEVFTKGKNFYALELAKAEIVKEDFAIIVEGYTDVISLYEAGFKNCVATLGTALTQDHLRLLSRFTAKAYLTFDSDEAGAKAAERALGLADSSAVEIFICILPEGYDPSDYVKKEGRDKFKQLLGQSKPLVEFCIERVLTKNGFSTAALKKKSISGSFEIIANVVNSISRQDYLKYLAEKTQTDLNLLINEFNNYSPQAKKETPGKEELIFSGGVQYKAEIELLKTLLNQPQLTNEVKDLVSAEDFSDENLANIFTLLVNSKNIDPAQLVGQIENEQIRKITNKLLMSPVMITVEGKKYIREISARLKQFNIENKIKILKTELEKMNPLKVPKKYDNMFQELVELEAQKREFAKLCQGG